jgi:hypothetical protein
LSEGTAKHLKHDYFKAIFWGADAHSITPVHASEGGEMDDLRGSHLFFAVLSYESA